MVALLVLAVVIARRVQLIIEREAKETRAHVWNEAQAIRDQISLTNRALAEQLVSHHQEHGLLIDAAMAVMAAQLPALVAAQLAATRERSIPTVEVRAASPLPPHGEGMTPPSGTPWPAREVDQMTGARSR